MVPPWPQDHLLDGDLPSAAPDGMDRLNPFMRQEPPQDPPLIDFEDEGEGEGLWSREVINVILSIFVSLNPLELTHTSAERKIMSLCKLDLQCI